MDLKQTLLKKFDNEEQIVWSEVYVPDYPDAHGDFATAKTVKKLAYNFLRNGNVKQIDVQHDNKLYGCYVVESFIAREDDSIFIPGSWVMGVHIPDGVIWKMVKDGELNGFSMELLAVSEETELDINIPAEIRGMTSEDSGHAHKFVVRFDKDGTFLGGETDVVDGHFHRITKATATDEANGHLHLFSFLEQVV